MEKKCYFCSLMSAPPAGGKGHPYRFFEYITQKRGVRGDAPAIQTAPTIVLA